MAYHIYHYNVNAEQKYFLNKDQRKLFDLISLNGNIVSHTPTGIAGFIATVGKKYYIDPQTHAFQHPTIYLKKDISDKEKGEKPNFVFKSSVENLAKANLGSPFSEVITSDKPIRAEEFFNDTGKFDSSIIENTCKGVLNFQKNILFDSLGNDEKEFIEDVSDICPSFLIAPYFYLSPISYEKWFKINLACYKEAKQIEKEIPVYFSLVISQEAYYDKSFADTVTKELKKINPDGVLIWIDDFAEEDLMESKVIYFVNFIKKLKNTTEELINTHGGYLSILLCNNTWNFGNILDGVAHSINYGEHRNVIPVGGGIPFARFYMQQLHSRLKFSDALSIILPNNWLKSYDVYRKYICKCEQCMKIIKPNDNLVDDFNEYNETNPVTFRRAGSIVRIEYPTSKTKRYAAWHYLFNKAYEFEQVKEKNCIKLLEQLNKSYISISSSCSEKIVSHLSNWHSALNKINNN